jgi:hypothetical protein
VRLDIKINDEEATPLACIVHREKSYQMGKALTEKLKELIPRQLFKVCRDVCVCVCGGGLDGGGQPTRYAVACLSKRS